MLKTNGSHVHTIRNLPEDVNRSRYMRALLHANRKYRSHVGRQLRTPSNACKYIHLQDVMRFNDRINDWLWLFYREYIATIKLIYRQLVYSLRINRKIETNRNGYNDCNGEKSSESACLFLAHLSRRLMGELIVYQSLRRPSVVRRPSVHNFKHHLL